MGVKFEVGDVVRCLNGTDEKPRPPELLQGADYTVAKVPADGFLVLNVSPGLWH